MDINTINTSNTTNFKGKVIYKNALSTESEKLLQNFLAVKKDGKSNLEMIKNKSYDLFVSDNLGNLTLTTNYKRIFLDKPQEYYLVGLKKDTKPDDLNYETNFFRWSLKAFKEHKKDFNGYNNIFEKIIAAIKEGF